MDFRERSHPRRALEEGSTANGSKDVESAVESLHRRENGENHAYEIRNRASGRLHFLTQIAAITCVGGEVSQGPGHVHSSINVGEIQTSDSR